MESHTLGTLFTGMSQMLAYIAITTNGYKQANVTITPSAMRLRMTAVLDMEPWSYTS